MPSALDLEMPPRNKTLQGGFSLRYQQDHWRHVACFSRMVEYGRERSSAAEHPDVAPVQRATQKESARHENHRD
jgi:hypothetical protein